METRLKSKLLELAPKMEKILPKNRVEKEISFAIQAIVKNPKLASCTEESILQAVYNIAQTGATLNPILNLAYLVPYKNQAKLIFSYIGLMKILKEMNQSIRIIMPVLVFDDEKFEYNTITGDIIHIQKYVSTEEEEKNRKLVAGYCIIVFNDGKREVLPPLAGWEIEKRRKTSAFYESPESAHMIWPNEMRKKTLIRYYFKYLIAEMPNEVVEKALEIENSSDEIIFENESKNGDKKLENYLQ